LTTALAETGASVLAMEIDRGVVPVLRSVVEPFDNVTVVEADAQEVDWPALLRERDDWVLVANLPYNVGTPLVMDLLDTVPAIRRMLVMVQREVGERLAAAPGSGANGIPSVKVAYWADADVVARVPPTVFLPRPRVESAIVRITRRADGPATAAAPARLFELVRAGFGQRRKMLRRSLAALVDPNAFERAGIRPEARAEELSVEDWGRLTLADAARS
jgi:16S rRNA (adenine1518-N6/adenine1519-N6)-dimethyltransferase